VTNAWATHFNLGHANMVADLYADDAKVSFSDGPLAEGRAAIEAGLTAAMGTNKPQITIHDVATQPFGADYVLDAGWWETTAGGKPDRTGEYMILGRKAADGTVKILWHYSNGRPGAM
jgi:ketosteroid isomerase-like protein